MMTNIYPTKSQSSHVRVGQRHQMGGDQYRREMRAALHDLQQRLGQSRNGPSGEQVVVAGPAPSTERRTRRKLFPSLRGIYTFFTSWGLF